MADTSDEQTWWSNLFTDGADTGLEVPDDLWESVVATALEVDAPDPADDLMPADQMETRLNGLDDVSGVYDDVGHLWVHADTPEMDVESQADDAHHDGGDHENLYDDARDDPAIDDADMFDDPL